MREFRMLLAFAVGAVLLIALVLALTSGPSPQTADPTGPEFIPEEAKINLHSDFPYLSTRGYLIVCSVLSPGVILLIIALGCLSSHRYRVARLWAKGCLGVAGIQGALALVILAILVTSWHTPVDGYGVDGLDFVVLGILSGIGLYGSLWILRTSRKRETTTGRRLSGLGVSSPEVS